MKLLIVDDNSDFRQIIRQSLTKAGYEVVEAGDGRQTLDLVRTAKPDLILLDILMPGTDGYELCRQLKTNPTTSQIPIMVLTALGDPLAQHKAQQAGADEYVAKPVSTQELQDRVERLLARYELYYGARRRKNSE